MWASMWFKSQSPIKGMWWDQVELHNRKACMTCNIKSQDCMTTVGRKGKSAMLVAEDADETWDLVYGSDGFVYT
jgi:hypothetical protein